jgi:hypothetical protein
MNIYKIIGSLIIFVLIFSCSSRKYFDPEMYIKELKSLEKILTVFIESENTLISATYFPSDLYAAKSIMDSPLLSKDSIIEKYSGLMFFNLDIYNIEPTNKILNNLMYLQFDMEKDITLILNNTLYKPIIYQYENNGNLRNNRNNKRYDRIFISFDIKEKLKSNKFYLKIENEQFNTIKLDFDINLNIIPKLKI